MPTPGIGKVAALVVVLAVLLLGLAQVTDVVREREGRLREAERSVAESLASRQTLVGPVLSRQCTESWEAEQGEGRERKTVTERREFRLAVVPQRLEIGVQTVGEARHRGIFEVQAYAAQVRMSALWDTPAALQPVAQHPGSRLACDAPVVFVAVADARGIRTAHVSIDGQAVAVVPGTTHHAHPRGLHAVLPKALSDAGPQAVEVNLELIGTQALGVAPVGEHTEVALRSDWPHPSFEGRFLPAERELGAQGFVARWRLSALATSAPQELLAAAALCEDSPGGTPDAAAATAVTSRHCIETFGVGFIDPVSPYRLSDRATKYGLLFIALSFVGVGLVEGLRAVRVHPVQYALVGSALVVFFLLLVSLTEHLPFGWAYAIASGACTLLLGYYGSHVLQGLRPGLLFGGAIGGLYAALYLLLRLEQSALVIGAGLLFAVLAVVMVATRRIDWYAMTRRWGPPPEPAAKARG